MMFVMVMMLAFSAVCSASNGKVLDSEEALAAKFLNGDFKAVSAVMSDDMKKNWDEKAYANFKEQITKNFGKINTNQLIVVENIKMLISSYIKLLLKKFRQLVLYSCSL